MTTNLLSVPLVLAALALVAPVVDGRNGQDEEQIRQLVETRWPDAFNAANAYAVAAFFTDDADFVTANGFWWRGRPQIEQALKVMFAGPFLKAKLDQHVEAIRFLAPDLALVHVWMEIKLADGKTRRDRGVRLFVKREGTWRCRTVQNTTIRKPPANLVEKVPGTQERVMP